MSLHEHEQADGDAQDAITLAASQPAPNPIPKPHVISNNKTSKMRALIDELMNRFEQSNQDDADCQQLQTEFIEFTEYMPSDMERSEQLIKTFDKKVSEAEDDFSRVAATLNFHIHGDGDGDGHGREVTKVTPHLAQVEAYLLARNRWLNYLRVCEAEKARLVKNSKAFIERLSTIADKLTEIRESIARNPDVLHNVTPSTQHSSPPKHKTKTRDSLKHDSRLVVNGHRYDKSSPNRRDKEARIRSRSRRKKVLVVPGDIMAPGFLEQDLFSDSDDSADEIQEQKPGRFRFIIKAPGPHKIRIPKQNKVLDLPPTNSQGTPTLLSTTNAIARLEVPPADAAPGSIHAPWLQLTEYELASLRKKMKKNAVWGPSATMLARELHARGRGVANYRAAKIRAEAAGDEFASIESVKKNEKGHGVTARSMRQEDEDQEDPITVNKGMKLNDLKKAKREAMQKEAAMAAEEMSGGLKTMLSREITNSFLSKPTESLTPAESDNKGKDSILPGAKPGKIIKLKGMKLQEEKPTTVKEDKEANGKMILVKNKAIAPKRKRNSATDTAEADGSGTPVPEVKRARIETPVPAPRSAALRSSKPETIVPLPSATSAASASDGATTNANAVNPVNTVTTTTTVLLRASSPRKSSTPILPPVKEKNLRSRVPAPISVNAAATPPAPSSTGRATRAQSAKLSGTPTSAAPSPPPAVPIVLTLPGTRRPPSRSVKAASSEPSVATAARERPSRRSSTVHDTPVPEPPNRSRRANKRQPPGTVESNTNGTAAVTTKRINAPKKKAGSKKQQKTAHDKGVVEVWDEIDDMGNIIDPDEPKFCICHRVSYGTMIGCENDNCAREWFHLECVNLVEAPPRTTKWYCPECRIALKLGEKGEISARGKKS